MVKDEDTATGKLTAISTNDTLEELVNAHCPVVIT
jgi:hypothetical protein